MENQKVKFLPQVFFTILKWFIGVISVALFLTGVRYFYLKINKFPDEIEDRIAKAMKSEENENKS